MKKSFIAIILCVMLLLSGCSANNVTEMKSEPDSNYSQSDEDYGAADYSEKAAEVNSDENSDAGTEDSSASSQEISQDQNKKEQKLVYTCTMNMESLEYEKSVKAVKEQIKKFDGIIEEENESDSNQSWYSYSSKSSGTLQSYLVIRIPADKYNDFLESISGSGKITSKNMNVENITKHYSEVETTIKSLQTQEARLLEMMEKASSVEDMITVESRLTEVQNELAQYKNTLASLDTDVSYSTIYLTIKEVVKYDAPTSTFKERLKNALETSRHNLASFLEGTLFFLILFGPIILVIILLVFIIVKIILKLSGFSKKRKEKKQMMKRNARNQSYMNQQKMNKGQDNPDQKKEAPEEIILDETSSKGTEE